MEAQAVERVVEVLHRLVNLHNCSVWISYWKEVWSACRASTDQSTGKKCLALQSLNISAPSDRIALLACHGFAHARRMQF